MEAWQLDGQPPGLAQPVPARTFDHSRTDTEPAPRGASLRPDARPRVDPHARRGALPDEGPRLLLDVGDGQYCFDATRDPEFVIGRSSGCDVVLSAPLASRHHARLCFRRHFFVLVDESSNGTWWRSEDGQVHFVHRRSVRLWGDGELSFGEPLSVQSAVGFRIQDV